MKINQKEMYCQYTTDTVSVAINDSYEKFTYEWFAPFAFTTMVVFLSALKKIESLELENV